MDDLQLIEAAERYSRGEMSPEEQQAFETLRRNNADIDQQVVAHLHFLKQLGSFGERKEFKSALNEIHNSLESSGEIKTVRPKIKPLGFIIKYRRVIAVAASIAGLTALMISSIVNYVTPKANTAYVEQLSRKVHKLEQKQNALSNQIVDKAKEPKIPVDVNIQSGGTAFLVDGKGYLLTNAHVIGTYNNVVVQNSKGQVFKAKIIKRVPETDLAILKIEDEDFKSVSSLPYGFRKSGTDLGEQIFTLGYPRDEIVYGQGYMSAKTGFNGDTLACQIAVAANPGNSGGPVINKNGEVIGILSTRQIKAEGVVFAIKSRNILNAIEELKQDTTYRQLKVPVTSSIKNLDRVQQIKKIQDCVFMVKTY
jgi:S1-C subfamily serine protease